MELNNTKIWVEHKYNGTNIWDRVRYILASLNVPEHPVYNKNYKERISKEQHPTCLYISSTGWYYGFGNRETSFEKVNKTEIAISNFFINYHTHTYKIGSIDMTLDPSIRHYSPLSMYNALRTVKTDPTWEELTQNYETYSANTFDRITSYLNKINNHDLQRKTLTDPSTIGGSAIKAQIDKSTIATSGGYIGNRIASVKRRANIVENLLTGTVQSQSYY